MEWSGGMYFIKCSNKIRIQLEPLLRDVKGRGDSEKAGVTIFSKVFPGGAAGAPAPCFLSLAQRANLWGQRERHPPLTCFSPQPLKERSERCFCHQFGQCLTL